MDLLGTGPAAVVNTTGVIRVSAGAWSQPPGDESGTQTPAMKLQDIHDALPGVALTGGGLVRSAWPGSAVLIRASAQYRPQPQETSQTPDCRNEAIKPS